MDRLVMAHGSHHCNGPGLHQWLSLPLDLLWSPISTRLISMRPINTRVGWQMQHLNR